MLLGGGRKSKEDVIDMSAGITLVKKANEVVNENDILAICYSDNILTDEIYNLVLNAFVIN